MKHIFFLMITSLVLFANIFDDINIQKANKYYLKGDYNNVLVYYKKVQNKSSKVNYNIANILYKQKKYQEAISYYKKITKKSLQFDKLYNIANAYAMQKKYQFALKKYNQALKIKDDADAYFNKGIIESLISQKRNAIKSGKACKANDGNTMKKNSDKNSNDDEKKKKAKKKKDYGEKIFEIKEKKDNISKLNSKNKREDLRDLIKEDNNTISENITNTDLSQLEEKKYNKLLESRELKSLLIPLKNKGEKKDAQYTYPW